MKRAILYPSALAALVASLPLLPAVAASPPPGQRGGTLPVTFTCATGQALLKHQPLQHDFTYIFAPGQSYSDTLAVLNLSKTAPLTVKVAISDAITPPQGGGLTYNPAAAQHEIGSWVRPSINTVTVAPNQYALVPVAVSLPSSVRPGEYDGVVDVTNQQPTVVRAGKGNLTFYVEQRCGVSLRVTGHASAGLRVVGARVVALHAPYRTSALAVKLRNTGTVIDRPIQAKMTLTGANNKVYVLAAPIEGIVGGGSTTVNVVLGDAMPAGTYQARIQVAYAANIVYGPFAQQMRTSWSGKVVVP